LFKANVIGDPYYGLNDFNLRWIAWANWTYSTTISANKKVFSSWLLFNGLDTFADIELCGKHIASTCNQFRQYYFDVSQVVQTCEEQLTLSINFGSAAEIAKRIAELPNQETWPDGVEGIFEFSHRQFVRKEQNDFGWDWGPAFVPSGVWQPAFLVQLEDKEIYVRNTLIDIYRKDQLPLLPPNQENPWIVNASIDAVGHIWPNSAMTYELYSPGGSKLIQNGQLINITQNAHTITGSTVVSAKNVELWWPVGLGPQTLYSLRVNVTDGTGKVLASVTKRVGFRTIILNQEPIRPDQRDKGIAPGSNWHFEINGHEFYAKGSNLIPPDAFWTRVTERKMRRLFNSVVSGNQNMLRVWSSGAYLPDYMYDIADGEYYCQP
jgi:beta-mannosidase